MRIGWEAACEIVSMSSRLQTAWRHRWGWVGVGLGGGGSRGDERHEGVRQLEASPPWSQGCEQPERTHNGVAKVGAV